MIVLTPFLKSDGKRHSPALRVELKPYNTRKLTSATFKIAAFISDLANANDINVTILVKGYQGEIWLDTELSQIGAGTTFIRQAAEAYAQVMKTRKPLSLTF
jgi:hypothetical protein